MVTIQEAYTEIKGILENAGIEDAAFEADILFEHVTGKRHLLLQSLESRQYQYLLAFAQKRATRYPLQYIIGHWPFFDMELAVGPGVLIPRPETEEVCLAALSAIEGNLSPDVLDLCAGTGALALGVQRHVPNAAVIAVELDKDAFSYLKHNCTMCAKTWGRAPMAVCGDAFTFFEQLEENSLDLIVSNPPYVTQEEYAAVEPELLHEPAQALLAGEEGLVFYRVLSDVYFTRLRSGASLVFEIGTGQGEAVYDILQKRGYTGIEVQKDLAGHNRIVLGRRP